VAKPELGTKRLCAGCGAKYYDLNANPISCPKCGTVYEIAPAARSRVEAAREGDDTANKEATETEFVSLEEADAEAKTGKVKNVNSDDDMDLDEDLGDDDDDDSTFIADEEEGDDDVSDIIGDVDDDDDN